MHALGIFFYECGMFVRGVETAQPPQPPAAAVAQLLGPVQVL